MSDPDSETIIAQVPKNKRETLRVTLSEFKGHKLCGLRAWAGSEDAEPVPTKSGFAVQVALIPALREALADAETEARRRGWLSDFKQAANG